jgi:hypothetical protein
MVGVLNGALIADVVIAPDAVLGGRSCARRVRVSALPGRAMWCGCRL